MHSVHRLNSQGCMFNRSSILRAAIMVLTNAPLVHAERDVTRYDPSFPLTNFTAWCRGPTVRCCSTSAVLRMGWLRLCSQGFVGRIGV